MNRLGDEAGSEEALIRGRTLENGDGGSWEARDLFRTAAGKIHGMLEMAGSDADAGR